MNPDKLIDLRQSELSEEGQQSGREEDVKIVERLHEDPTGLTAEPEMCKNVDQNVNPEQSEAAHDNEEQFQAESGAERIESSQEILELTEKLEETSLQHQDCDQTTSQELRPEQAESEQPEMSAEPEEIPVEQEHSEDQFGQHLEESPQMELAEEPTQPENADQPEESTPSEQTDCIQPEDPVVAEQQEQMEPSEQSEQTTDSSQPTLSEQLEHPEEIDESEITEQLSAETEVTQQTAEAEFSEVDKQAETSHQAEEAGHSENGSVQTVLTNGEQPKPPETAVSLMNGGEVDREKARCLAERLFKLDGIQRVDVVKHLDKE